MSVETVQCALLWSTVINYAIVIVWAVVYRVARPWVHRLWAKWLPLTAEQFDIGTFCLIGLYKLGILMFNLVPYIALRLAAG
jgi:hypothetical protein